MLVPIKSLIRIGEIAVQRFLEVFDSFVFGQSIGNDVQFDAAGDENAVLKINSEVQLFSHECDSEWVSGFRRNVARPCVLRFLIFLAFADHGREGRVRV